MNDIDIKEIREILNISQTELAKMIGVAPRTIQNWEAGGKIPNSKYAILHNLLNNPTTPNAQDNYRLVPLYSQDVVGGVNNQECDTNGYITGYIPFVNATQVDIAVPVTNNSMYPTYPATTHYNPNQSLKQISIHNIKVLTLNHLRILHTFLYTLLCFLLPIFMNFSKKSGKAKAPPLWKNLP